MTKGKKTHVTTGKKDPFLHAETFYENGSTDPYMSRFSIGDFSVHIMWRGDRDEAPHDHARGFLTFPLTSYVESTLDHPLKAPDRDFDLIKHVVPAFRFHRRAAEYRHRIDGRYSHVQTYNEGSGAIMTPFIHTKPGPIVTLVWWDKPYRRWGFWPMDAKAGRRWVWWRSHLFGEQDDEVGKPEYAVFLKPNNRTLWRIWCTWIMQTKYGHHFPASRREAYGWNLARWFTFIKASILSDWRYSAAMVELAEDSCAFMPPSDYEPMTPQDAISEDSQYWDGDADDE